jgi:hypothetical protein
MHLVRTAQEEKLTMALKYVFELFNCWEGGVNRSRMSKIRFHKVLRYAAILYVKAGPLSGQACLENHVNHSFLFRQHMYDVFNGHMLQYLSCVVWVCGFQIVLHMSFLK